MKRDIIIAIDDSFTRYVAMSKLAAKCGITVIITENPEYIQMLLDITPKNRVLGICMDHDMPGRNALTIARDLVGHKNYPVMIVSTNLPGAENIREILEEYAVPHVGKYPAGQPDWEYKILNWFEDCWDDGSEESWPAGCV